MSTFAVTTTIQAPRTKVWNILADIGTIAAWNPGVVESHLTSDNGHTSGHGVGATRYCDLGDKNYLDEQVVEWEQEQRLTMRITDTNLPLKEVDIRFTLQGDDTATTVTVAPEYAMPYGVFGQLMDAVYVRRTYKKGMKSLLDGLKSHAESRN